MKRYEVTESDLALLNRLADASGQRSWRPSTSLGIFSAGPQRVFAPPGRYRTDEEDIVDLTGRSWLLDSLARERLRMRRLGGRFHVNRVGSEVWLDPNHAIALASFTVRPEPTRRSSSRPRLAIPRVPAAVRARVVPKRAKSERVSLPIVDMPTARSCPRCYSSSFDGKRCETCKFGEGTEWGATS